MRTAAVPRTGRNTDELKHELEDKALQLMSVQRNYESMSRLMQLRQQEIEKLKLQYDSEQASCVSLGVQVEEAQSRAAHFESLWSKLKGLPDQLAAVQTELQKLRYDASVASSRYSSSSEKASSLQKTLEDNEFQTSKLQRQLESARDAESKAKAQLEGLKKEVEEARADGRAQSSELRAMRDSLAAAHSQIQAADKRTSTTANKLNSSEYKVEQLQDQVRSLNDQLEESDASHRATRLSFSTLRSQYAVLEGQMRSMQRSMEISGQYTNNLRDQLESTRADLKQSQDQFAEQAAKLQQLTNLLSDSEERYQLSLTQRVENDEVLTGLQVQLVQSRTMLTDARRQMHETDSSHQEVLRKLKAEKRASVAMAQDLQLRMDQERFSYSKVFEAMLAQVEAMDDRLLEMQSNVNTRALHIHDKQEKATSYLAFKVQTWEQRCAEIGEQMESSSGHLSAIQALSEKRMAALQEQKQHLVAGQAAVLSEAAAVSRLNMEVERLHAALMQEQYTRQGAQQTHQRQEAEHLEAMSSLRATLDERVELERQRLGARLSTLEAEAARLEAASMEAHDAAEQTILLERAQMQRAMDGARAEVIDLQRKLEDFQLAASNTSRYELASLSRLHNEDFEKMKRSMTATESDLKVAQSNISASWEAEQKLLSDMKIVTSHLVQMGWDIKTPDTPVMNYVEDGSGIALAKCSLLLRLNFSYITEAVQHMAKAPPKAPPPPAPAVPDTNWKELAKELRSTIAKIIHVEESLASNCTCMLCMEVFTQPVTCNPCGHTYCKACLSRNGGRCKECENTVGGA